MFCIIYTEYICKKKKTPGNILESSQRVPLYSICRHFPNGRHFRYKPRDVLSSANARSCVTRARIKGEKRGSKRGGRARDDKARTLPHDDKATFAVGRARILRMETSFQLSSWR